jgi:poly(A) polymerase
MKLMLNHRILQPVLPEIDSAGAARLDRLVALETQLGVAPDPLRRLAALLPPDPAVADKVAARLKLSNKARKRLAAAAEQELAGNPRALAYWTGAETAIDRLLLARRPADAAAIAGWPVPRLPISGGKLIKLGVPEGPKVAVALKAIERAWVEAGFPDGEGWDRLVTHALAK